MRTKLNKRRLTYVIRLCLLYLMIVLCIAIPPTLSKYTSSASGASTSYVAKFDVDFTVDDKSIEDKDIVSFELQDWYPGKSAKYTVKITNNSDVTVNYTIDIKTLGHLPLTFSWEENGTYTKVLPATDTLAIGASEEKTLYIKWDISQKDLAFAEEIDLVMISLDCSQVD